MQLTGGDDYVMSSIKSIITLKSNISVVDALPLTSSRQDSSKDDCLEDKREDYQNCSVLYCVQHLCTMRCIHMNTS